MRTRVNGIPSDLGIPFEDVLFHTEDEVALSGWYLENSTSRTTIIIIHDRDRDRSDNKMGLTQKRVNAFLQDVSEFGLLRKPVVFASLRYQRWLDLNPEATHKAKGIIIQDLYKDYKLQQMIEKYPEIKVNLI